VPSHDQADGYFGAGAATSTASSSAAAAAAGGDRTSGDRPASAKITVAAAKQNVATVAARIAAIEQKAAAAAATAAAAAAAAAAVAEPTNRGVRLFPCRCRLGILKTESRARSRAEGSREGFLWLPQVLEWNADWNECLVLGGLCVFL